MAVKYVYWDSMCFICRLNRNPEYIVALEEVTRRAEKGEIILVTSVFTLAEVAIVDPAASTDVQEKMITDFFDNEFIYPVAFDLEICKSARQIVRHCKVKGADAVHIATAASIPNLEVMHSNDKKVLRASTKVPGSPLVVQEPSRWLTELLHGQEVLDMEVKQ